MSFRYFDDAPSAKNTLWTDDAAAHVAASLWDCTPPFALGIHGDWGTGKTSLLRQVEAKLRARDNVRERVVWFDAWRHQFEAQPGIALLHAVRSALSKDVKAWNFVKKIVEVTTYSGLRLLDDLAKAMDASAPKGLATTAREEGERYEREHGYQLLPSEAAERLFDEALRQLLGDEGRVYVLVDDLDRCSDAAVVRTLEAMKLYFHSTRCVFVIAADRDAIVRAVQSQHFPAPLDKDAAVDAQLLRAEAYVEKFFQAVEVVPGAVDIPGWIEVTWTMASEGPPEPLAEACREALIKLQRTDVILPANPRRVKRFLGELSSRAKRFTHISKGEAPQWDLLIILQVLQTFHPGVYRVLEAEPAFYQNLVGWCKDPSTPILEHYARFRTRDKFKEDPQGADPGAGTWEPRFADPADLRTFRAARYLSEELSDIDDASLRRHLLIGAER